MPSKSPTHARCQQCGKDIMLRIARDAGRKKYCSMSCRSRFTGKLKDRFLTSIDRHCRQCGQAYQATRHRQTYCTIRCQTLAASLRYAARLTATPEGGLILLARRERRGLNSAELIAMFYRQHGRCAISGIPMTWQHGTGRLPTNISIDRIVPGGPYRIENIQLVCRIVNIMKHNLSTHELMTWCAAIVENQHALLLSCAG